MTPSTRQSPTTLAAALAACAAIASGSTGTGRAAEQFELLDELLVTLVTP